MSFHKSTQVLLWAYQQCLLKNICAESLQVAFWTFLATTLMSASAQLHLLPLRAGDAQHEQGLKAGMDDWYNSPLWVLGCCLMGAELWNSFLFSETPPLGTALKTQLRVTAALHQISHSPVRSHCKNNPALPDSHLLSLKSNLGSLLNLPATLPAHPFSIIHT